MAGIKVDPSQYKAIAGLMAILVGAVCVTAFRINKPSEPQTAKQTAASSDSRSDAPDDTQARVRVTPSSNRNPFEAPKEMQMREGSEKATDGAPSVLAENRPLRPLSLPMGDMRIAPSSAGSDSPTVTVKAEPNETPKPRFAVVAVITGGKDVYAIIKTNDSAERIVHVGDVLEGGYRVSALDATQAVLVHDKDTIIAKREYLSENAPIKPEKS